MTLVKTSARLGRLIRNQRAESTARHLTRVSAQMSGLMCLVFCLLDDRHSFRKWARTASLAGNEAGDPETLSWVLAQEAYGHFYSGDVTEALDVARHAYEVVQVPCTGAALSSALEARAYAITGRGAETRSALARAEEGGFDGPTGIAGVSIQVPLCPWFSGDFL